MKSCVVIVALAGLGFSAAAQADIAFSFADPIPGRQLRSTANAAGVGVAMLSYDPSASITLLVDGTTAGFGTQVFGNAFLEMQMAIGAASTVNGITTAPVEGYFRIYNGLFNPAYEILTGTAASGTFVRIANTNSILFSDPSFDYTFGAALLAITGAITPSDPCEAVFTLTDPQTIGGGSFLNPDGTFQTFEANSSFTGNVNTVPTPGALAIIGLGGIVAAGRRRRTR